MRARTWIATTAVSALAATTALVGVAAVGPANAAVTTQPAGVSVTVDSTGSNTAFVSSAVVANLTVRDNAASATIGAFTAVVPAGVVGPVKVVGVDHGWGYTTLPCAGTANCSAIVLAYASLPLSSSILRPGQAVTIAFSFRTPATPTSLPLKFLGIGNGLFTATSTPTINVINGVAGSFCVSPIVGPLTAGDSRAFTVQAVSDGLGCANVATKKTGITATDATVKFSTPDSHGGGIVATTPGVTPVAPGTGSTVVFHLPTSATGFYAFSGTFDTATPAQSIVVSTGTAAGNNDPFVVNPDVPWDVQVLGVLDKSSQTTTLSKGAVFVTRYAVFDHLGNFINTPSSAVTIAVTGGTFTRSGGADPVANPAADGTVEGAFAGTAGAQLLTAKVGARTSNDFPVTFAAFSTGTATLFPDVPAIVTTPACDPSAPNTTCAESGLGKGANGTVTFGILSCTGVTVGVCGRAGGNNLVDLEANFKHTVNNVPDVPLYTATAPASITLHCTVGNCLESKDDPTDVRNSQDAKVDDFEHYQPVAQLVGENALAPVPSCQPGNEHNEYGPAIPAFTSVPAGRGVCVDQTSFVRDSSGNLSATLYFYEDFKGSMG